jgi:hypothetical protein
MRGLEASTCAASKMQRRERTSVDEVGRDLAELAGEDLKRSRRLAVIV